MCRYRLREMSEESDNGETVTIGTENHITQIIVSIICSRTVTPYSRVRRATLRVTGIIDDTIDDVTVKKNLKTESIQEETNIFEAGARQK